MAPFTTSLSPWRRGELLALLATIPAFYMAALSTHRLVCAALYLVGCAACTLVIFQEGHHARQHGPWAKRYAHHQLSGVLAGALLLSAILPLGEHLDVLGVRLATALLIILRCGQSLWPRFWRGGLAHLLTLAVGILGLCGLGFWWLEPQAHTFGDGLWLAFTTAATVGYGDIVPTTPAAKIFAVFVVLMGFAALSLVTAAIAAMWVQSEEKRIEDEILRDLHLQIKGIRDELAALRHDLNPKARG